jgi:hypothetical protein
MTERRSLAARFAASVLDRTMESLIERYAPELPMLVNNAGLPDAQFYTLLDWAEQLQSQQPLDAFAIDRIPKVLNALNVAFLSCCAISRASDDNRPPPLEMVDLEIRDAGGADLVHLTRGAACIVTVALHGAQGEALVLAANARLNETLEDISARIARKQ